MATAIVEGIASFSQDRETPNPSHHAKSTRKFIIHQNKEGWAILLLGYIPTILFDSLTTVPSLSRNTWVAKIIAALENYHLIIWNARNALVHSSSDTEPIDQIKISLQNAILAWYQRQQELTPAGRSLLPPDPESIYRIGTPALAELNVQLTAFHTLWTRTPSLTQDIRKFFQPPSAPPN